LTGSTGSIPVLNKNSKRHRFSKKKVNRLQPGFWLGFAGSSGSHRVMAYSIFSSTRLGSSPESAGSRVSRVTGRPAGPGFKTIVLTETCKASPFNASFNAFDLDFIIGVIGTCIPWWYLWADRHHYYFGSISLQPNKGLLELFRRIIYCFLCCKTQHPWFF